MIAKPMQYWLAAAAGIAMLLASMWLRPLWRDEYLALYFSAPDTPVADLLGDRLRHDVHPPFYFALLYAWRQLLDTDLWARALNLMLIAGAGVALWRMGRDRKAETALFLVLCATSYQLIFNGVEVRPTLLQVVLGALTVFVARNALETEKSAALWAVPFAALGAAASSSHYFGAAWAGALGGALTLGFLLTKRWGAMLAFGAATIAALAPAIACILVARPQDFSGEGFAGAQPLGEAFGYGANQFLRGLVVKTMGSNVAAFAAGGLGLAALFRKRDLFDRVLLLALALMTVGIFAIHLFFLPLIKERAFAIMMPGVVLLAVRAILALKPEQKRAQKLAAAIPIVAALSPLLFVGEYFKDREQFGEVRKVVAASGACAGAPVVNAFRPSDQAPDFSQFVIARALKGATESGGDLRLVDAKSLHGPPPSDPTCRVKAMALLLGRGEREGHAAARAELRAAGVPLDQLEEVRLGKGRSLVWIAPR
jgi:hypothetical protein